MAFDPTPEQVDALEAFGTGGSVVIEALAGTGKTSTLDLIARSTTRRGQYVAFNKALTMDAAGRFPANVACNTAHSLAFRAVGKHYRPRLDNSRRMRSEDVARFLGLDPIDLPTGVGTERRRLAPGFLAGHVLGAVERFCQSADEAPGEQHFTYVDGLDMPEGDGRPGWTNNREMRRYLAPYVGRAWGDLRQLRGTLPFKHSHYLKIWERSRPVIEADFILWDECQDVAPVMESIVRQQTGVQLVAVGDAQQSLYEWSGAIDALSKLAATADELCSLTQSFRFGPEVAEMANTLLARLGTPLRVRGFDAIRSTVVDQEPLERPHAVLCRTNAAAVRRVIEAQASGRRPFLVGNGSEVLSFARAAAELQTRGHTSHPELACFTGWPGVQAYVENDPSGSELRLLVRLVDEFGTDTITDALGRLPREADADVVVSTAHKSKGREWSTVALADDFPAPKPGSLPDPAELRLLYVAVTRARHTLDITACPALAEPKPKPVTVPQPPKEASAA